MSIIVKGEVGGGNYWEWYERAVGIPYKISGKYLFFSKERALLKGIAVEELENNGFHLAKIPLEGKNLSEEFILCLYYKNDSRKQELRSKYQSNKNIKYRYWKSDEDTENGKYSKMFLSKLSKQKQKQFPHNSC